MEKITEIAQELRTLGIESYYVGGYVRDYLLGNTVDDIDICLVGVTDRKLTTSVLEKYCSSVSSEKGSFPIWICTIEGKKVDFAVARKENLVGKTRKDFLVETENVSIEEDLKRRDLTVNSIAINVLSGDIIDPYDGRYHLQEKIAHPTSDAFREDSLRVIRAARFISKFGFDPSTELMEVCKSLKPNDISNERVGMELKKLFKSSDKPSLFFYFLKEVGWLGYYFQELQDLIDIPQDPIRHPEGCAFFHTLYTIDEAKDWFTRAVMLCHDLGKAKCTTNEDGKIRSIGHEEAGIELTKTMLKRIHFDSHKVIGDIACLVGLHMLRFSGKSEKAVRTTLRELSKRKLDFQQLVEVCRCDVSGRPPLEKYTPDIGQELAKKIIENNEIQPIVTGDIIVSLGIQGPDVGTIYDLALKLQDKGTLKRDNWKKVLKSCNLPILKGKL